MNKSYISTASRSMTLNVTSKSHQNESVMLEEKLIEAKQLNVLPTLNLVKTAKTLPLAQVKHPHENALPLKLLIDNFQQVAF